ncbi:MAG: alpha/beta hydrolase [Gemmatimonadaceae bacterium]|nr:alpha/beta hydrolase [Gemmatimonadaceae bacterium]
MTRRTWLTAVALLFAVVVLGPRPRVAMPATPPTLPKELTALPAWLAEREAKAGVTDANVAKHITFADSANPARTPWSVIYLHGFSATRQETAPVSAEVARALGANLFETRLRGHGLPGDSLAHVTAQDWLADTQEAFAIAQRLGDSVLVIGTSTGGTLAVWLATQPPEQQRGLARLVLISPNFGPKDRAAEALTLPWAQVILPRFIPQRTWKARNDEQTRYWTVSYPSTALFPMQALVERVRSAYFTTFVVPTLVFNNHDDQVVDAARTDAWVARARQATNVPVRQQLVVPTAGEDGHVIAGRIVAPSQTATFVQQITDFVRQGR